jgi:hypothetical protein
LYLSRKMAIASISQLATTCPVQRHVSQMIFGSQPPLFRSGRANWSCWGGV